MYKFLYLVAVTLSLVSCGGGGGDGDGDGSGSSSSANSDGFEVVLLEDFGGDAVAHSPITIFSNIAIKSLVPLLDILGSSAIAVQENLNGLNLARWNYSEGAEADPNLGIQTYSSDNFLVENGALIITAKCDPDCTNATSAKLDSKDKFEFRHGKIEARIKVPAGESTWSNFSLIGENFPDSAIYESGKFSIMEIFQDGMATGLDYVHSTVFWDDNGDQSLSTPKQLMVNLSDDFHIYRMEWNESSVKFSIDDFAPHLTVNLDATTQSELFDNFYLELGLFVDGTNGKAPNQILSSDQKMYVDWIKVSKKQAPLSLNLLSDSPDITPLEVSNVDLNSVDISVAEGSESGKFSIDSNDQFQTEALTTLLSSNGDHFENHFRSVSAFDDTAPVFDSGSIDPSGQFSFVWKTSSSVENGVHKALVAFSNLGQGFAADMSSFVVKTRVDNFGTGAYEPWIEVRLFGGGSDSVAVMNIGDPLYSTRFSPPAVPDGQSTALGDGWFDLKIPLSAFTNDGAIDNHTGYMIRVYGNNGGDSFEHYFTDTGINKLINTPDGGWVRFTPLDLRCYSTISFAVDTSNVVDYDNASLMLEDIDQHVGYLTLSQFEGSAYEQSEGYWSLYTGVPISLFNDLVGDLDLASVSKLRIANLVDNSLGVLSGDVYLDNVFFSGKYDGCLSGDEPGFSTFTKNAQLLPTGTDFDFYCVDEGVSNGNCARSNPDNPFRLALINDLNKWSLFDSSPTNRASFHMWSTALALNPTAENQYYTALTLKNLRNEAIQDQPLRVDQFEDQLLKAYRATLDDFFCGVTYLNATDFLYVKELVGIDMTANLNDPNVFLTDWGYTFENGTMSSNQGLVCN